MHTISFTTPQPFDHVPRALDILRKMHFGLHQLAVEPVDRVYLVDIVFEQRGSLSADVFVNRLAQLDGLRVVENVSIRMAIVGTAGENGTAPSPRLFAACSH